MAVLSTLPMPGYPCYQMPVMLIMHAKVFLSYFAICRKCQYWQIRQMPICPEALQLPRWLRSISGKPRKEYLEFLEAFFTSLKQGRMAAHSHNPGCMQHPFSWIT